METWKMTYEEFLADCDRIAAAKGGSYAAAYDREDHETNYETWMCEIEEAIEDGEDDVPEATMTAYQTWHAATEPERQRHLASAAKFAADEEKHGLDPSHFRGVEMK